MSPRTVAHQAFLSSTVSQSCLEHPMGRGDWQAAVHGVTESDMTEATDHARMSTESEMPSNHLILRLPLLLLPSILPSTRVFSSESVLHIRWQKYWSFSLNISPSNEYSGLISFRIDWLDLPAVQGTLKSLFQHHSSKASILWCSAVLIIQVSHPYMTTGKNHSFD